MIRISVNTRHAYRVYTEMITSGSSGIPVSFIFSSDWDGLTKIASFRGSGVGRDMVLDGDTAIVPYEVLTTAGGELMIGVYGTDGQDGAVIIPTIWADVGRIREGVHPCCETDPQPTASVIDQVLAAAMNAVEQADAAAKAQAEIAAGHAEDAANSASAAAGSATAAAESAASASASKTAAAGSASAAHEDSAAAIAAKNAAETAQGIAEEARDTAVSAKNAAETAQRKAETAQGKSETAKTAAEAAAQSATGSASSASASATAAGSSATSAAGSASSAHTDAAAALEAKNTAVSAKDTAVASKFAAVSAKNAAENAATNASGSATAAANSATAAAASAATAAEVEARAEEVAESIPEDYSELSDDVANLKSAKDLMTDAMVTSMGTTVSTTWERYGYNANAITATNKRLMSTGTLTTQYITTDIKTLNIAISGNYWFSIQLWDDFVTPEDYSECTPIYNSSDWQKTDISFDLTPYPTAKTFTVVMRRSDNGTISTTAYVNLSISLKSKDNYYERVSTHASDSGYYAVNIIGEGETLARVKIPVTPNTEYKVSLPDNAWSLANTGDAAARWVFVVQDGETPSGEVLAGRRANGAYKNTYFVTPTEESINISIRATENAVVRLALMDTSKTNIVDYITNTAYGDNINSKYVGERPELLPNTYSYTIFPGFAENGFTVISDYITEHFSVALNRQSIAVYGDYLVRGYNCGGIAIYDIHTGKLISDFMLPLSDEILTNFHCSNISFGNEFVNASDTFPLFYASETTGGKKGYVFQLTLAGAVLKQIIEFTGTWGTGNDYRDFIVDCYSGDMWIVGYYNYNVSGNYTICKKVPLPLLNAGTDIVYTDSDVLDSFTISDIRVIQGAFLRNGHLYIGDQRRYIDNISLTGKSVVGYIDLSSYTRELEGIAPYQGAFLVDLGTMYSFRLY